jgi:hypothetical protein
LLLFLLNLGGMSLIPRISAILTGYQNVHMKSGQKTRILPCGILRTIGLLLAGIGRILYSARAEIRVADGHRNTADG